MNSTFRLIAASAIALIGTAAFAAEGEQPSTWMTGSTMSRAEARAAQQGSVSSMQMHEGSGTVVAASGDALRRMQVIAEAREAQRLGLLASYDGYTREATSAEREQIRQAGLRAIETRLAGK